MNTFINKLYQSFLDNSNHLCLSISDKNYTYKEVLEICNHIRTQLKNIEEQNIGLYLSDDVYMYASILAIWFEGKTYVPVHGDFPVNKNIRILEQSEIIKILSSKELSNYENYQIIDSKGGSDINNPHPLNFEITNNAYILFTSGSTGNPKGVPIKFSNLNAFADAFDETFGKISYTDTVLQMFDLTFDLSVMSYLIPWLKGACVVGLHRKEAKFLQILDLVEANKISVALMVPSILNLIIPYLDENIKNTSLKLNLFCGEPLLVKQIETWRKFVTNADIYNVYGPTENTIFCSYYKVEQPVKEKNGIICIGRSIPNSNMSFEDENNNEGELLLSGDLLTSNYWKDEEKTNQTFFSKDDILYYKTGDWCKKDEEGDFYFLNRVDFQAKINGFRIELSEVEHFANKLLDNAISVAVISKDHNDNDVLSLFINDTNINENSIIEHLKQNLPEYGIPSKIIKIKEFPINTSGKIDRKILKEML